MDGREVKKGLNQKTRKNEKKNRPRPHWISCPFFFIVLSTDLSCFSRSLNPSYRYVPYLAMILAMSSGSTMALQLAVTFNFGRGNSLGDLDFGTSGKMTIDARSPL